MFLKVVVAAALLALSVGCTTAGPTHAFHSVSLEQRGECKKICDTLEMELSSMVVVANSTGCVCNMKKSGTSEHMTKMSDQAGVASTMVRVMQRKRQEEANQHNSGHH